jgi:ABC-type antimicrobial peptide transport system permease subunit
VFSKPASVVISESVAQQLFGHKPAVGKIIYSGNPQIGLEITGVMKDVPANTHLPINYLVNNEVLKMSQLESADDRFDAMSTNWFYLGSFTYVRLISESDNMTGREFLYDYLKERLAIEARRVFANQPNQLKSISLEHQMQSIHDIHLFPSFENEIEPGSDSLYVWVFMVIAIFILIMTALNFVSLSMANADKRFKDVALRKIFGAGKRDVAFLILIESVIYSFIALLLALVIVELAFPYFNQLFEIEMAPSNLFYRFGFIGVFIITLLVGVMAGCYPAYYFGRLKEISVLRVDVRFQKSGVVMRGLLLALQLAITMFLITFAVSLHLRNNALLKSEWGFERENLFVFSPGNVKSSLQQQIKEQLRLLPFVESVGEAMFVPGDDYKIMSFKNPADSSKVVMLGVNEVDSSFFEAMDLTFVHAEWFGQQWKGAEIVLNQSAAEMLAFGTWPDNMLRVVSDTNDSVNYAFEVVGVVENVSFQSSSRGVQPMVFIPQTNQSVSGRILVKTGPGRQSDVSDSIDQLCHHLFPDLNYEIHTYAGLIRNFYENEQRLAGITIMFSLVAVFLYILGSIAMVTFLGRYSCKARVLRYRFSASSLFLFWEGYHPFLFYFLLGLVLSFSFILPVIRIWFPAYTISHWWACYFFSVVVVVIISAVTIWIIGRRELNVRR